MFVTLSLLAAVSLALSLMLTPMIRVAALRLGLVDLPDNKRKLHKRPVPRVGGVSLAIAYFGSTLLVAISGLGTQNGFSSAKAIAPAALLIFSVGLADDLFSLKPSHKLVVEVLAALMVAGVGIRLHDIAAFNIHPIFGVAATVVWLVACTNALNLIDGMDGLAAGVALVATATAFAASLVSGRNELAIVAAPLGGALLGFLVFNFNPASIFLGDSGSLVLGFLLGCYGVMWIGKAPSMIDLIVPLMALAIPLLDVAVAIVRRFLRKQPIFRPDRSHIHHRLLALGFSHRRAVLCLYLAAILTGALSLCLMLAQHRWGSLILPLFVCAVVLGIRKLRYAEFHAARCLLVRGGFRRELNAQLALESFQASFSDAANPQECCAAIQHHAREFGLHAERMQMAGYFSGHPNGHAATSPWAIRIQVSPSIWVELTRESGAGAHTTAALVFADTMRQVLREKSTTLLQIEEISDVASEALYDLVAASGKA